MIGVTAYELSTRVGSDPPPPPPLVKEGLIKSFPHNHSTSKFQLASTVPDKDFMKVKPKTSIFIENLTRVPLKLEKPKNRRF